MFPLCERMRETVPSFLYSTLVVWGSRDIADFWSGITEEGILLAKDLLSIVERKKDRGVRLKSGVLGVPRHG